MGWHTHTHTHTHTHIPLLSTPLTTESWADCQTRTTISPRLYVSLANELHELHGVLGERKAYASQVLNTGTTQHSSRWLMYVSIIIIVQLLYRRHLFRRCRMWLFLSSYMWSLVIVNACHTWTPSRWAAFRLNGFNIRRFAPNDDDDDDDDDDEDSTFV